MSISAFFNFFCIFSFIGWLYESIYCSLKQKQWENRGFLFGPLCPIYGVGADLCVFLFGVLPKMLGIHISSDMSDIPLWEIFIISMAGSVIIEYGTSYVLEKVFHSLWWDYSDVPFNINGRVCLPATLGFGIAGIVVVKLIVPVVLATRGTTPPVVSQTVALILMFFFGCDFALTVDSLTTLTEKLETAQKAFDEKMESGYQIFARTLSSGERYHIRNILIYVGNRSHRERRLVSTYYGKFRTWIDAHEIDYRKIGKK